MTRWVIPVLHLVLLMKCMCEVNVLVQDVRCDARGCARSVLGRVDQVYV